ncbi:MAG: helix-turn-helix domain-containing protein [Eubacteriaceae bacterium]|nr:helix-turn-helix domain-containing protein [Eubacteriaceae bacterium]
MRIRKDTDDMNEQEVMLMAKCSDALAHPARIYIFRFIMKCNTERTKVCNKDIVEAFDYAQATISQHINKLSSAGLVDVKKEDKYSYYYANIGMLIKYLDITRKFELSL